MLLYVIQKKEVNSQIDIPVSFHFQDQLENEWCDIDNVFNAVMDIVEEARARALKPIDNRRQVLQKEANGLKHELEAEINNLETAISELDNISVLEDHILFLQVEKTLG